MFPGSSALYKECLASSSPTCSLLLANDESVEECTCSICLIQPEHTWALANDNQTIFTKHRSIGIILMQNVSGDRVLSVFTDNRNIKSRLNSWRRNRFCPCTFGYLCLCLTCSGFPPIYILQLYVKSSFHSESVIFVAPPLHISASGFTKQRITSNFFHICNFSYSNIILLVLTF